MDRAKLNRELEKLGITNYVMRKKLVSMNSRNELMGTLLGIGMFGRKRYKAEAWLKNIGIYYQMRE